MDVPRFPKLLEGMEVRDTHDRSVKRSVPFPGDVFVKIKRRKLVFSAGNGAPVPSRQKERRRDPFAENDFSWNSFSLSLSL